MTKALSELKVYTRSMDVADQIWEMVDGWNYFCKDTMGKQIVRSVDSIAVNISEGHGRYYYKENKLFCYYGRGSASETRTWFNKALRRKLIAGNDFTRLDTELLEITKMLNSYINYIGTK